MKSCDLCPVCIYNTFCELARFVKPSNISGISRHPSLGCDLKRDVCKNCVTQTIPGGTSACPYF